MPITSHISVDCVVPELRSPHKADVLKELTHLLFEAKKLKGVGPAVDQIMARETTESTGIGHGIAVPHARVAGLKNLICAVGRSRDGLDYGAIDKKPVHLVFLICYPPVQQTTYLCFVAGLARVLRDEKVRKSLLAAEDNAAIYAILENISTSMSHPEERYAKPMKADPDMQEVPDAHADLDLLLRLQQCQEMHDSARTGKRELQQRIEKIRSLVDARILKHYDRLVKGRAPAVVPVEGDTCQGCFMKLPSQFAQKVRQDQSHVHTCPNCSRFIRVV